MRLSVERLRWGVLAGALLLVAVLVVLMGYGRYRAVKMWRRIVARSGATITHETNGFTYSQAIAGRTVFTLHAAKAVPHGDGKYTLHDAVLVLYSPGGAPADRIYGSEFDYDQNAGVARALGEVNMELQPPEALSTHGGKTEAQTATSQTIHVRTSGLVYVRKLGVAATDQEVELEYQGLHGFARGAEFDTGQSVVHLLNDVRVNGDLHGRSGTLVAAKADLDRKSNVITLVTPVAHSGERMASAEMAVLHLRKDGSVEHVHAEGDVVLRSGSRTLTGPVLEAAMNAESLLEHAEFAGGVTLQDSSAERPMHGTAGSLAILCKRAGELASVVAQGTVTGSLEERTAGGQALHRQMAAERVVLTMSRSNKGHATQVSEIEATGSAWMRGESPQTAKASQRGGVKTVEVRGDDLRLAMQANAAGRSEPQALSGTGHTRLEQRTTDGGDESSTGDALLIRFAMPPPNSNATSANSGANAAAKTQTGGLRIVSAEQTGHVSLRSLDATPPESKGLGSKGSGVEAAAVVSTGSADRAVFDAALNHVDLYGRPRLQRGNAEMVADEIGLDAANDGDALAQGRVEASFVNAQAASDTAVTHATAVSAVLRHVAQTIEFRGTDARPARLWQGASQLEAASVTLDRAHDTLVARPAASGGLVHAVFASQPGAAVQAKTVHGSGSGVKNGVAREGGEGVRIVRIASARLDYSGAVRQAVFSGGVHAEGETGDVTAERGIVFLRATDAAKETVQQSKSHGAGGEPDPFAGSVDRIVLSGNLRFEQPGRYGTGEQMLYTASSGEFVLTGGPDRPPRIVDQSQGSLTGATLVFRAGDSTIVVAGEPPKNGRPRGRVHTETQVRP